MKLFRRRRPRPDPVPLRRVRELEVVTARLLRRGFAGQYHAAFHGSGIEFSQVREYQPGDDIRTIDWNVTARSGIPHVKQFVEERDLSVLLALDVSGSMSFGSLDRRKIDLAVELAAVLAFAALQNGDRVGLVSFAESVRNYLPPKRGRTHVEICVRTAVASALSPGGSTDLGKLIEYVEHVSVKRSVVIFLSDFLDIDFEAPLRRLNKRHDVVAIDISDPRESRFPSRGIVDLVDAETGRLQRVDLRTNRVFPSARLRSRQLTDRFRRSGIDMLGLSTAVPYDKSLLRFFRERSPRRR
ncbi:MAG: DUF58 domain-containing protein [Thermoanaerobaculia bacterium]